MTLEYTPLAEINAKHAAVLAGFRSGVTQDLTYRRGQLRNLYYAVLDHEQELKRAVQVDLHRSPFETEVMELNLVLNEIKLAIDKLDDWAADTTLGGDLRFTLAKTVLRKTPYGVVLIIGPWNYPYLCTLAPIVSALAAGNTVVLKPTEVATESSRVLTRVLSKALDPQAVQVVNGSVKETSHLLNELAWNKIMLTGSGRVGTIVATAAAQRLTPVTLELGGKSPTVISANANLALSAKRLVWAKFVNAGQTCIAPDYVIIDDSIADEFVAELKRYVQQEFPATANSESPDYAHIITDRLFARAEELVQASHGKVWQHGRAVKETRFFPPTIVDNVSLDEPLMQDEIFGPILPIVRISAPSFTKRAAEVIVQGHDHPLAMYIFTNDKAEQEELLNSTRSGAVMINDALMQGGSSNIPFGGVGTSGNGRYHGKYGFDEFTFERPVVTQPTWVEKLVEARYPPYTDRNAMMLRLVGRPLSLGYGRTGPVTKCKYWAFFTKLVTCKYSLILALLAVILYRRHF